MTKSDATTEPAPESESGQSEHREAALKRLKAQITEVFAKRGTQNMAHAVVYAFWVNPDEDEDELDLDVLEVCDSRVTSMRSVFYQNVAHEAIEAAIDCATLEGYEDAKAKPIPAVDDADGKKA